MSQEKINITYIDASEEEDTIDDLVNKGDDYTIDDCVLVRTTDIFPTSRTIRVPKKDNAYSFGPSSIMGDAIEKEIKSRYPNLDDIAIYEEKNKYNVVFETCRSTVHFTLNGLVESHMYGNFDNRSFIIFEPLKYHINSKALKSLRVEDVYFDDDVELSSESSILISENIYNSIANNLELLEALNDYNVFVYRGDQRVAVRKALQSLGYDAFIINQHGYLRGINDGTAANEMWSFAYELSKKYGVGFDRHFGSAIQKADTKERIEKGEEIDIKHLLFILENSKVPEYLNQKIREALKDGIENNKVLNYLMTELVKYVGLNRVQELTIQFNEQYIEELKNNKSSVKSS